MIFDFCDTIVGVNQRFKPRNKITVNGWLEFKGQRIAALSDLVLFFNDPKVCGGRFQIAWHRTTGPIVFDGPIDLHVEIVNAKSPTVITHRWWVRDLQILHEGAFLAVQDLNELLGHEIPFFGWRG